MRRPSPSASAQRDRAEAIAIEALGFLASDDTRIERFLALSGLGPENLRQAAADPGFLAAVVDHVAGDESLVLAFAANSGRDPTDIQHAREALGGSAPDSGDM
jgi:hypothetical protein